MKSTVFKLDPKDISICQKEINKDSFTYNFLIPTLNAYAVEYITFHLSGMTAFLAYSTINNAVLSIHSLNQLENYECHAVIHYHGIRDYSLLFPSVSSDELRVRLGEFYREAELAFDQGSWLTFMLMCGAIFEGILFSKLDKNTSFNNLIDLAHKKSIIDNDSYKIMSMVREYRNLVHANRYTQSYVSRSDAMDTRRLLDTIIKKA